MGDEQESKTKYSFITPLQFHHTVAEPKTLPSELLIAYVYIYKHTCVNLYYMVCLHIIQAEVTLSIIICNVFCSEILRSFCTIDYESEIQAVT